MRITSSCGARLLAATASLALVAVNPAPAFADVGPGLTDEDPTLNAICQLQPNVSSGFTAIAINVESVLVDESTEITNESLEPLGSPEETLSALYSPHKHGGAHHIWALQDSTSGYTEATHSYTETTTYTYQYVFDCHVHKTVKGKGNDAIHGTGWNAPPDQQVYDVAGPTYTVVDIQEVSETVPYEDPNYQSSTADVKICQYDPGHGGARPVPPSWETVAPYAGSLGTCGDTFFDSLSVLTH